MEHIIDRLVCSVSNFLLVMVYFFDLTRIQSFAINHSCEVEVANVSSVSKSSYMSQFYLFYFESPSNFSTVSLLDDAPTVN